MIESNIESILKFFEKLEEEQRTDDESILLCIHCDYSGHIEGSMSHIILFSFDNLKELVHKLKPYENGKKIMIFTEND
jgi:hypothetical protein